MNGGRIGLFGWLARWVSVGLCVGVWPFLAVQAQVNIPSREGKLNLPAYWFKADANSNSDEPRPVVIALHGCSGALDAKGQPNPSLLRYAGYFNAERIHFVLLDSFSPRGQTSICATRTSQRTIHEENRREDVFATIAWLARQPSVDALRIIVVGWSHGAQTVLSVMDANDSFVAAQTILPKAAAAFYPGCSKFVKTADYRIQAPVLVMIGARDDWTLASHCVDLREKLLRGLPGASLGSVPAVTPNSSPGGANAPSPLTAAAAAIGASFDLEVYPDSYHGFDGIGPVRTRQNVGNTRSGNATVGGNPAAQIASHRRLFEFVATQVGEPLRLSHSQRLEVKAAQMPLQ